MAIRFTGQLVALVKNTNTKIPSMKSTKLKIFSTIFLFSIFLIPSVSLADGIVPCGNSSSYSDRCTLCHLFKGIENIVDWGKNILIVVAFVSIVAGAIMYIISAGDSGMMEKAKTVIKQALWGVVIVLGAWIIINTILLALSAKKNLGVSATNWYTFECEGGSGDNNATTTGDVTATLPVDPNPDGTCPAGYYLGSSGKHCIVDEGGTNNNNTNDDNSTLPVDNNDNNNTGDDNTNDNTNDNTDNSSGDDNTSNNDANEQAVRDKLSDAGINVNVNNCCYGSGCTCVGGLRDETVNGIIDFKNKCDAAVGDAGGGSCNVTISGGSEDGVHGDGTSGINHKNGYKVDIRTNPQVNAYIKNEFEKIEKLRDGKDQGYIDNNTGATYYNEGNHWDVTYNSQG